MLSRSVQACQVFPKTGGSSLQLLPPVFLLENIFSFLKQVTEDVLVVLFALFAFKAGKLLEQTFLFRGQAGWRHHFDDNVLIAASAAVYYRYPHPLEAERAITLCTSRNLEIRCLAIHCRHFNLVSEGCLSKADRQFIQNVVALPLEELVRLYRENNIQVARSATTGANFTFASDTHINAIIYASRDIHYHATIVPHAALATTFFTRGSNNTSLASTTFTHRDVDELTENGLLYTAYLTSTLTC